MALYERELSEKARIIQEKMIEIQTLKIQQDGDYFLTSLLTRPLIVNRNVEKNVQTEFIVRQKKTFHFRQRRSELGGDLCITDTVELRGKRYTVFLNGDAMGKSMQGAGGALVLGVVFNAYLSRSKYSAYQQSKTPEHWLKDSYLDLQNVFIAFEGSMLVSVVIGLVEVNSGICYFINAEHPFLVLYRNRKAMFIDREMYLRKIGTPGQENLIRVQCFQMLPGDILIAGSDGRDDLEVAQKNNIRIINEDETAFLNRVEEGRGNLKRIIVRLRKYGRFTDDLSLLKIRYQTSEDDSLITAPLLTDWKKELYGLMSNTENRSLNLQTLIDSYEDYPLVQRYLAFEQLRYGYLRDALSSMMDYFNKHAADTEIAYHVVFLANKLKEWDIAIDFGEKVALREPENIKILVQLSQLYIYKKNWERSEFFAQRAFILGDFYAYYLLEKIKSESSNT